MYITINDVIGEKRIDQSYPIMGKDIAVVSMLSDNVQYWLQGSIEVLLKTGKKIVLNKGVYTDKELNTLIGMEMRVQMLDSREDVLRTNKLEKVTKMVISLNELDNSDDLKDGKPSNALFTYYVMGPEYSMHFEPVTPQYKKLKNGMISSLSLKITDQNNNIDRAIIKKLAVKFEGNEILSIDNYDVFACYRDLWKTKSEKKNAI